MKPLRRLRAVAGFTLLELVIVVAIFGVLSVMAYGGLNSVLTTRTAIEASMNRTAEFQRAYQRLRGDFQQLRPRTARDEYGQPQPALIRLREGGVEFTRGGWRNPLGLRRSTLERVAYRLEDARLLRLSWRVLDRAQDSKPVETVMLDGVEEIEWRFLDAGREWQDAWPAESGGAAANASAAPPLAVELVVRTKDWDELRFLFRTALAPQKGGK